MAQSVDDGEFWLPPEFLTDDDLFVEKKQQPKQQQRVKGAEDLFGLETDFASNSLFSHEFPFGFGSFGVSSDLSSPVESVVSSAETESDEEDHLSGLTRRLTHTTLDDDLFSSFQGRGLSGSPQSTLCGASNRCGCKPVSSQPPATWDLLHAAADEVAKMKFSACGGRGLLGGGPPAPPREPSPVTVPSKNSDPCGDFGFYPHQSLSYHQLQASQVRETASATTVLLPARVVQALELNLNKMGVQPAYHRRVGAGARFAFENDAMVLRNQNGGLDFMSNEKQGLSSRAQPGMEVEVRLPQEWTY
ncbi:hypothetical protein LINPERHAP1_LOCUS11524 [Linum perenne]